MEKNIILETRKIGAINGDFYIESYQRGYRWESEEVERLLDDIYINGLKNYCLQPIVVKRKGEKCEVIDGQQRLTTIFLIFQYIHKKSGGFINPPQFSIDYRDRENSKEFLYNLDLERESEYIDFYYLSNAYKTIDMWFSGRKQTTLTDFNKYLNDNVEVIWYEVDDAVNSIALFTRLNIGKIPLTSAELVKAMFLSKDINKEMSIEKQEEISLQWDNIEGKLHNEKMWYFLTNNTSNSYQTRIDLILDLLSNKQKDCREKYYTYFEFDKMRENKSLQNIWDDIQHTFLLLNDWFEKHELYHKIGYLITSNYMTLQEIFDKSKNQTKDEFTKILDNKIKDSIKINCNYSEYSYNKSSNKIYRLLLLFNVESVRKNGEETQWFPFDKFKAKSNGKVIWSLEHIHAQNSEGMKTVEVWHEWLKLHLDSIKTLTCNDEILISNMENCINNPKLDGQTFEKIKQEVLEKLSLETSYSKDSIANLALLNSEDNAALNNSTFDVKRNKIIEMEYKGKYIPFCTKMVFLKYYTPSQNNQLHFWGQKDMEAYISNINSILKEYLDGNEIKFESGVVEND